MLDPEAVFRDCFERVDRALRAKVVREFLCATFGTSMTAETRAHIVSSCCYPMTAAAVYAHDCRLRRGE